MQKDFTFIIWIKKEKNTIRDNHIRAIKKKIHNINTVCAALSEFSSASIMILSFFLFDLI